MAYSKNVFLILPLLCLGCSTNLFPNKFLVSPEEAQRMEAERQAAIDAYHARLAECEKMRWDTKKAFDKQTCLNKVETSSPIFQLVPEIQAVLHTANLKAALDYDEGKISQKRFFLLKQENELTASSAQKDLFEKQNQINQQNAFQQAQLDEMQRLRRAQAFQAINQSIQQNYQPVQTFRPVNTTCNRFGSSVNCTSY